MDELTRVEVADGMRITWDAGIPMDDGLVLRADVFGPDGDGRYPVILAMSPYGKGLRFDQGRPAFWNEMVSEHPEICERTSGNYQNWERVDPERWVPDGYVCIRVDSRGSGRSPGVIDVWSARETQDLYDCVEWAAAQPWSNGRVGLLGISYHAMNQWHVAALQPPHLSAICVWEGAVDFYRDASRHGGILSSFPVTWYNRRIPACQHGVGDRGPVNELTGETVNGPETLPEEELSRLRVELEPELIARELVDDFYRERSADLSRVTVPLLSVANWGGQGMHSRGNFEGFVGAASPQKWLAVHGGTHFTPFYTDHGVALQKRFFGHFLKDEDTGWTGEPRVQLSIRHPGERFEPRGEAEWPLARTEWTKLYLDPAGRSLSTEPPPAGAPISYQTGSAGVEFCTPPLGAAMEITGPVAARLVVSSHTTDADVFVALTAYDADGVEIAFQGSNDPRTPIGLGWLRASHRKLDPARSLPYRPFHTHDEKQPLVPGEPVVLDIEIWPTCIVLPAGARLALQVRGRDYVTSLPPVDEAHAHMNGTGPFRHDDPRDRPPAVFTGLNTLHFPTPGAAHLLLPVIPPE